MIPTKAKAPTKRRLASRTLRRSSQRKTAIRTGYQPGRPEGMAYFELAQSPLRAERQGPIVGRRPIRQVERPDLVLSPEDVPPSVQRGWYYRAVAEPAFHDVHARARRREWRGALVLVDAVLGLLAWGSRPWTG
jgi:hypothetical protein